MTGGKIAEGIRALVNKKELSLECVRVLHKNMVIPPAMYGSKTIIWKEREGSKTRTVQVNNLGQYLK